MKGPVIFVRNQFSTKAEKIDADTAGTREDDDACDGGEDQPAGVAAEEDDAVPEPGHVHLVRQPGKTWQKMCEEGGRVT